VGHDRGVDRRRHGHRVATGGVTRL
jgi:hypothetical protein